MSFALNVGSGYDLSATLTLLKRSLPARGAKDGWKAAFLFSRQGVARLWSNLGIQRQGIESTFDPERWA